MGAETRREASDRQRQEALQEALDASPLKVGARVVLKGSTQPVGTIEDLLIPDRAGRLRAHVRWDSSPSRPDLGKLIGQFPSQRGDAYTHRVIEVARLTAAASAARTRARVAPEPTPAPVPARDTAVTATGFGQEQSVVGWGFRYENPDPAIGSEGGWYRVSLYAADGTVLKSDEHALGPIAAGERGIIAGTSHLAEGATVARIEVQIWPDHFLKGLALPVLTTDPAAYQPNRSSPKVKCRVAYYGSKGLKSVRVSALLLDTDGRIVGGGCTYLSSLPAKWKGAAPVEVSVNGSTAPARVELYAHVTPQTMPPVASKPSGFNPASSPTTGNHLGAPAQNTLSANSRTTRSAQTHTEIVGGADPLDASKGWHSAYREHGKYGSFPVHDDHGEESEP
jgi:hypothetical protein